MVRERLGWHPLFVFCQLAAVQANYWEKIEA